LKHELERFQPRPTEAEIQAEFRRRNGVTVLDDDVVIAAFERARNIGRTVVVVLMGSSIAIILLVFAHRLDIVWGAGLLVPVWIAAFLGLWRYYGCPQCGELPLTDWRVSGFRARQYLDLDPPMCRKCGARLR